MIANIDDLRNAARRRLPKPLFDYIDGGSEDEVTLRANRSRFDAVQFRPRILVDAGRCDLTTRVLGESLATPILLAPTGLTGMFWRRGEIAAARAAAKAGTVFVLSTMAMASVEEVAAAAPDSKRWFQTYVFRDREMTAAIIKRAEAHGYSVLCVTADVQVGGNRERDVRNGLSMPLRVTLANLTDLLRRVPWMLDMMIGERPTFKNVAGLDGKSDAVALATFVNRQFDPSLTWKDLAWIRRLWPRKIVLKGVTCAEDARLAVENGLEGVIVSNHGGRQLDGLPATIDVLSEVVDAVGGRAEVLFDGGIARGTHVIKALALGARACLIGRAFLYGLAAKGEAGVLRALTILNDEIRRALTLLGCSRVVDIDRTFVRS